MAEGLQAGRLEVPVVANLAGFAERLRTAVETAAEGVAAKVKVEVDSKGLRRRLKTAVKEASKGVTAKIRVEIDEDRFRASLDRIRRRIDDTDLNLPVRPDGEDDGPDGGRGGGLLARLRRLIAGAQGEADRNPVNVPVQMRLPGRRRGSLRTLGIGALITLIQPAVAALTQYGAALTALVSAAAPAVGVLGALPGLIAATGTAVLGTIVAFGGFGEALKQTFKSQAQLAAGTKLTKAQQQALDESLKKLSDSARKSVKTIAGLSKAWGEMRKSVQERFFSKIADEIKPLSEAVLPLLKDSLGDAASQMGELTQRGAQFMQTGVFRRDFKAIAGSNSKVIGNLTNGIANLGRATLDFLVASGPFVERVGKAGEAFTRWLRASAAAGRETGSLARFLDHAGDKAAQLGRATRDLGTGLAGVGRAAQDSGNALLDGFEGTMARFTRWANSGVGKRAMQQFFSDAAPTFHELNRLVGDFIRGLGRMAKDGGITDLVRQIRTELMPAFGAFFNAIGQSVGPALISLISNLATAVAHLSEAGTGLGVLLAAFNGLLVGVNALMNAVPGATTAVAALLGTLLALKVITAVTGMLRNLGNSVRAAGTSLTALGSTMRGSLGPGVIGPQITMWQQMRVAYRGAAQQAGGLQGALRGVAAANRTVSTAVGGMVSALGGPLGIVITGVTLGLGLLATRQEQAARAARAHEERVESLTNALAASGGVIDANVRAQAAQLLQDTELADGKGKLVDVMRDAGVGLRELTDAYLEQGGTIGDLQKKYSELAEANKEYQQYGREYVLQYSEQGKKYKAAADALKSVNGELAKTRERQKELGEAVNGASGTGATAYDRLSAAVQGFSDKTKSADQRVDNLKNALNELAGNTQSFHDASAQLNSVMLQIDDTMKGTISKTQGWGKALIDADGLVNTTTRNGQTLNTQLTELRDSMLSVATRAQESAEQGLLPMSEAMDKSQAAMERARAKAIELAVSMGIPEAEAKALADQMGLIPSTVTTLMQTEGLPKATAEFLALQVQLGKLGEGQTVRIKAPTVEAREQLRALGYEIQRTPDGKHLNVTAPTGTARANLNALAKDIANAPDSKSVTVQAIVKKAAGELEAVRNKVVDLPPDKKVKVEAPTKLAQQELKDLGYKIKDLKGKKVEITAPSGPASEQVRAIQARINSLRGKTVNVTIKYSTLGKPYVSTQADGGIVRYAEGGIRRAGDRLRAFANGAERHIAQIAKPGEWRLWAEPETGGEAYIPLARSKRRRSEAILDEVARIFGGRVVYFANGALSQNTAQAPTALNRPQAPTTYTSRSQQGAPAALVGGDLNLTMTSAPMSPGEALNEAMFELRRIRRGGVHVAG